MPEETPAQLVDQLLTAADRDLLAAVHCWARTHGWTPHDWLGWINAADSDRATIAVRAERVGGCGVTIFRRPSTAHPWPPRGEFHAVSCVGAGVDLLVSLRIIAPYPWRACDESPRYWPTAAAYSVLRA